MLIVQDDKSRLIVCEHLSQVDTEIVSTRVEKNRVNSKLAETFQEILFRVRR